MLRITAASDIQRHPCSLQAHVRLSECLRVTLQTAELRITTDLLRVIRHQASSLCPHQCRDHNHLVIRPGEPDREKHECSYMYIEFHLLYNDAALWFIKFCFLRWKSWWGRQAMFKIPGWRSLERVSFSLHCVAGQYIHDGQHSQSSEMESCERNLSRNSPILMYPLFISMFRHVLYREFIENIHLRLKCCNSL